MAERQDPARVLRAATSTPLFGRDAELGAITRVLEDPSVRLLCLTGRGGVGKTRLACEIARTRIDGASPTTFVPLVGVADEALVPSAIAAALGLPSTSKADPVDLVAARLGSDDHLLILDNLEHILGVAPELDDLLDRCPGLRILGTSQAPLRLRAERVVRIEPLPVPDAVDGASTIDPAQPAIATYLAAASSAAVGFEPERREAPWVIELCRRLEGLPLAIELAGARAASLRPEAIVRCLDEVGIAAISRPRSDAPARHHDLGAAIAWTFDLLPPAERLLHEVLSVGAGSFSLDTVLAAGDGPPGDVLDQFSSLVDLHLVEPFPLGERTAGQGDQAGDRYVIASSIREHALGRSQDPECRAAIRRRYVRACASLAGPAADEIEAGVSDVPLAARFDDGLASALQVAIADELVDDALDIVRVLAERWDTRGYHRAHEDVLERCLALAEARGADPVRLARAKAWSALVGLRHTSSRSEDELVARLAEAEAEGDRLGDDLTVIWSLTVTILVSPITGDLDAAARAAERSLELASRPANRRALNSTLVWAGMVAHQRGDEDTAVELGRRALDDARASGDPGAVARTSLLLRPLVDARPELEALVPSSEEALDLARRAGQPFYEAIMLVRLVEEAVRNGDRAAALGRSEESLLMARSMVGSPLIAFHLLAVMVALELNGDAASAAVLLGVLRPVLPLVDRYQPAAGGAALEATIERIRTSLGDDELEALAARGSGMPWTDAVELALDSVREARDLGEDRAPAATSTRRPSDAADVGLTARQAEVLRLLAGGRTNKDIAVHLGVSAKTVMHHTVAIYRALGVSGRSEATAWAYASGFLAGDGSAAGDLVH